MRKIIDEKGRVFGLINLIDIIVLAVVTVVAATVIVKFIMPNSPLTAVNSIEVTYSLRIPRVRTLTAEHLRVGDKMYLQDTDALFGTIVDVRVEPAQIPDARMDGSLVMTVVPEEYDIFLLVEGLCSYSNDRYYTDRTTELFANSNYWLYTKYNNVVATLMGMKLN